MRVERARKGSTSQLGETIVAVSQDTLPSPFPIPFLAKYYYSVYCIIGVLGGRSREKNRRRGGLRGDKV